MLEAPISPNLFLERLTSINKIEKRTAVGIGQVISVGKMQMYCRLMSDYSVSQIGSKYARTI